MITFGLGVIVGLVIAFIQIALYHPEKPTLPRISRLFKDNQAKIVDLVDPLDKIDL